MFSLSAEVGMPVIYSVFHCVVQNLCYLEMGGFNRAFMDGDK